MKFMWENFRIYYYPNSNGNLYSKYDRRKYLNKKIPATVKTVKIDCYAKQPDQFCDYREKIVVVFHLTFHMFISFNSRLFLAITSINLLG